MTATAQKGESVSGAEHGRADASGSGVTLPDAGAFCTRRTRFKNGESWEKVWKQSAV